MDGSAFHAKADECASLPYAFTSPPLIRRLVAGVVIIDVLVALLVGIFAIHDRNNEIDRAIVAARNLSGLLRSDLNGQFDKIDLSLQAIKIEAERQIAAGGIDRARFNAFIMWHVSQQPGLELIRVASSDGDILYGSEMDGTIPFNISHRDYFHRLQSDAAAGLLISEPLVSISTGRWSILLVRRITAATGAFAGVVVANIDLEQFEKQFSKLDIGSHGSVSLRALDLSTITRYPTPQSIGITPGNKAHSPQWKELLKTSPISGSYSAISPDGLWRTLAYNRIGQYPLYVLVGLYAGDYLSNWGFQISVTGGILVLFIAVTWALAWLVARAWQRREADSRKVLQLTQLAVETSKEHLSLALDGAKMGEWATDPFTGGMSASAWTKTLYGLPADAPLDIGTFLAAIHPDDRDMVKSVLHNAMELDQTFDIEMRTIHPDGSLHWLSSRGRWQKEPMEEAGRVIGVVQDITERKNLELELKSSNAELEQFAYVASHDLREPLRMISSYLSLLDRRYGNLLDANGHEFIGFARDGAKRMDQLVLDLLDLSRITRHGEPIAPMPVQPAIQLALTNLGMAIAESEATIQVDESLSPCWILGDPVQIMRLVQNLIGNGLKYRKADVAPTIRIDGQRLDGRWEFRITDNGIGIAAEYFERIFGIFQRLHTREHYEGTGIGLAVCKKIIERHGGSIWLESQPNVGTTFFFTLSDGLTAN